MIVFFKNAIFRITRIFTIIITRDLLIGQFEFVLPKCFYSWFWQRLFQLFIARLISARVLKIGRTPIIIEIKMIINEKLIYMFYVSVDSTNKMAILTV